MSGTNQLGISNSPVGPPQFVASFILDQALSHGRSLQLKRYQRKIHAKQAVTINRLLLRSLLALDFRSWHFSDMPPLAPHVRC